MSSDSTASLERKFSVRKILLTLLKLGIGALAIYLILQKVQLERVGEYLKDIRWPWLFISFLAFFTSKVVAAFRINTFYRSQGLQLAEKKNLQLSLLSMFYNLFVPLVGGEAYRIYWLKKRFPIPTKKLIWASLLDRVNGLVALLTLALLCFPLTSFDFPYKSLSLLLIPLMYLAYYLGSRWFFASFQSAWWRANGLSLVVQALQVACTFSILLALNVGAHQLDYIFVFLISCLAYVLPFIGAREMAFVFGADFLGLNPDLSLTISLLFYLALALTSMSGLYFLFYKIGEPEQSDTPQSAA